MAKKTHYQIKFNDSENKSLYYKGAENKYTNIFSRFGEDATVFSDEENAIKMAEAILNGGNPTFVAYEIVEIYF